MAGFDYMSLIWHNITMNWAFLNSIFVTCYEFVFLINRGIAMIDLIITFLVFVIIVIGLVGAWNFATVMRMDVKDSKGKYLVKK